jgi:Na+-transporting methylmalonyl-CoA/oxaloacetate decarboxylase gamma subunit
VAPAGSFLGGAKGRLLPASIPLRFFGAAVVFHALAWLALWAGAAQWPRFGGGPGWVLAALHLLTLGVLGMSALGAGSQLLPVATRQPAPNARLLAAIWWLYTPGVGALALGMGLFERSLLAAGAAAVVLSLAAWGLLMARHLAGARGMPGVVAHVWAALVALAV